MVMPAPSSAPGSSRTPPPTDQIDRAIAVTELRREAALQVTDAGYGVTEDSLAWASFPYFISRLRDDRGQPLSVPWHIEEWALDMQHERLLCLLAARDHAKTWTAWAYILWRLWRHNRGADGVLQNERPEGNFDFVYFTANMPLAIERFSRLQQFMIDNAHLFGDLLPRREPGQPMAALRDQWSKTKFRLRNNAGGVPKSIGSAYRGPHPALIVADDIVSDKNARTPLQRGRVWSYLVGSIMPMAGPSGQLIVLGTPQHYEDALYRLKTAPGWRWLKYKAIDFDSGEVLWPERYDRAALEAIRDTDALIFSREYLMDPRDDVASIFPYALTERAIRQGASFRWSPRPFPLTAREPGDFILLGGDIAISESVGADYTVYMVILYNRFTQKRRLLWACREKGLTFDDQVSLLRAVCRDFGVDIAVVEQNNFQRWLHQHLAKYPETAQRVFGHTTGIEKQNLGDGVPGIKLVLEHELWIVPYAEGGLEERAFADVWRSELNAFGYVEGKLQGVGEHDDCVLATWFCERAVRMVEAHMGEVISPDVVRGEDVGLERVKIGAY